MGKLKLDLHTHCGEALGKRTPSVDDVRTIVAAAKSKGLDGLAITEHYDKDFGFAARDIARAELGEGLLIIPGWEIDKGRQQIVELFLTDDVVFRFLAHPSYGAKMMPGICGIELENDLHNWHIAKDWVRKLAQEHDLLLMRNSDAHELVNLGSFYNELDLTDLTARARAAMGEE